MLPPPIQASFGRRPTSKFTFTSASLESGSMALNHHQQKTVNWTRALPDPVSALHTVRCIVYDANEYSLLEDFMVFNPDLQLVKPQRRVGFSGGISLL